MNEMKKILLDVFALGYRVGESRRKDANVATEKEILDDALPMVSTYLHDEAGLIELTEEQQQEANVD